MFNVYERKLCREIQLVWLNSVKTTTATTTKITKHRWRWGDGNETVQISRHLPLNKYTGLKYLFSSRCISKNNLPFKKTSTYSCSVGSLGGQREDLYLSEKLAWELPLGKSHYTLLFHPLNKQKAELPTDKNQLTTWLSLALTLWKSLEAWFTPPSSLGV